jgi:hypothetical protein
MGEAQLGPRDLRSVAGLQKAIIFCILFNLIVYACQFFFPAERRWVVALPAIPVGLASTVCLFMLALRLYSPAAGIILGLLSLVPWVNLIILLVVNQKATKTLQSHGIRVGFLGANLSQVPASEGRAAGRGAAAGAGAVSPDGFPDGRR